MWLTFLLTHTAYHTPIFHSVQRNVFNFQLLKQIIWFMQSFPYLWRKHGYTSALPFLSVNEQNYVLTLHSALLLIWLFQVLNKIWTTYILYCSLSFCSCVSQVFWGVLCWQTLPVTIDSKGSPNCMILFLSTTDQIHQKWHFSQILSIADHNAHLVKYCSTLI